MKTVLDLAKIKGVTRQAISHHARQAKIKADEFGRFTEADARKILSRIGGKPGPKRKRAA